MIKINFDKRTGGIELKGFIGDGFDGLTGLLIEIYGESDRIMLTPKDGVKLKEFLNEWLNTVGELEGYRVFI